MIRDLIQTQIALAVARLQSAGSLPADLSAPIEVADPRDPSHGDFACNYALVASKQAGMNPRELAEKLKDALLGNDGPSQSSIVNRPSSIFRSIEIAGPGFLNIRVTDEAWLSAVEWANGRGGELAKPELPLASPLRLNIEFVSVNPNGPITVGSGRGAAFGSTLANVMETVGHEVHREYYINDGTNSEQMRLFAETVRDYVFEAFGIEAPGGSKAYPGEATKQIAHSLFKNLFDLDQAAQVAIKALCSEVGLDSTTILEGWQRAKVVIDYARQCGKPVIEVLPEELNVHETPTEGAIIYYAAELLDLKFPELHSHWTIKKFISVYYMVVVTILYRYELEDVWGAVNLLDDWPADINHFLLHAIESRVRTNIGLLKSDIPNTDSVANELHQPVALSVAKILIEKAVFQKSTHSLDLADTDIDIISRSIKDFNRSLVDKTLDWYKTHAQELMLESQKRDLASFSTTFDTWFSEQSLHDSGKVEESIRHLIANGAADEEPVRRKLKLAKGGKIEDVEVEEQPGEEDDGESSIDNRQSSIHPTLWLRSTKFGDDMDRVLRRKDGRLTYIASDVAYHKDKFNRPENANKLITILGPDHHGYISRLHAVLAALELEEDKSYASYRPYFKEDPLNEIDAKIFGSKEERDACRTALEKARNELEVIIFQIVRFVKEGKPAPMRKRDGNIYSLRDLMVEIGKDAAPHMSPEEQVVVGKDVARFFYLMRSHDTHMDFDIDLATKGTDENPVFYVQYAHARICSILRKAGEEINDKRGSINDNSDSNSSEIVNRQSSIVNRDLHPKEQALIKKVLDLPWEVQRCAEDYGVHRLTTYAIELARTFHHFYDACRVIQPEEPELTQRRLAICEATRHALRGALTILGVSAPEKMERAESSSIEP